MYCIEESICDIAETSAAPEALCPPYSPHHAPGWLNLATAIKAYDRGYKRYIVPGPSMYWDSGG